MKNAAIYMRVNRNLDIRNQELESYRNECASLVKAHPDWCLKETYVDVGLGRKAKKCDEKLLLLLDEAYSGNIQVIIIPSILTFTRNNNDTLSIIRKLKEKGVDVCFVKEGIDTALIATDVLIKVLSSFENTRRASVAEGTRKRIRENFEKGVVRWVNIYGYRPGWVIEENEARVIRFMFDSYADGVSTKEIAERLNEENVATPNGAKWNPEWISKMLQNERYVGDVALSKSRVEDYTSHKVVKNPNLVKYIKDNHEGIVDRETFDTVQEILKMRDATNGACMYPFYGVLKCPKCGMPMVKVNLKGARQECVWTCGGEGQQEIIGQRTRCETYLLPDRILKEAVVAAFEEKGIERVSYREMERNVKKITLSDWDAIEVEWKDKTTTRKQLHFSQPRDALLPIIRNGMINGMPVYRRQRLLDGFENWQRTAREYRVLPPITGNIPRVVKPGKE